MAQPQKHNTGVVKVIDTGTEKSHTKTQDAHCNLNVDSSFIENNVFEADINLSKQMLTNNEYSFSLRTQNTPSGSQIVSTQSSSGEANNSPPVLFPSGLKSRDSSMHNAPLDLHSQRTDISTNRKSTWRKSSPLPHKDLSSEPVMKKLKSSGVKKTKQSTNDFDANFNANELAIELGFEKPNEKITIRSSGIDKEEEITKQISPVEIIQQVVDYRKCCKCSCLKDLSMRDIASHCMEITLLDRHSRDFFIMGLLRCGAVTIKETCRNNNRIRNRFNYRLMNTRICHCCFLTVNNIGGKYLKNLKKHFADHGVTFRSHGNRGRKPYHAISSSDITDVVEFVSRYATNCGVPAAKIPKNPKTKRVIRLPPQDNVTSVHKKYRDVNEQSGKRAIALTSFRKIWSRHLPHIKLTVKELVPPVKSLPDLNEPVPNVDSHTDHSAPKQMFKAEISSQVIDIMAPSPDIQSNTPHEAPACLPHEYSNNDMTRNQMMYLNDRDNHDSSQYGYIFSLNYAPTAQHIQTITTNNTSPPSVSQSSTTGSSHSASSNVQHPNFPVDANSSPKNMVLPGTFSSNADKHLLLLGSNSSQNTNTSQLNAAFTDTNLATPADPDVHHETSSHVESSLTNLSQQIHLSLMQ